ncbi:MAG TPA: gephyrin-like molybdotransferase Glp, partial [Roseimicrobium sp.]|nr:gephyrin-like molybdotransferase Glp [Roseimicrobium sp.]
SAMDGYAVRAIDVAGASPENPRSLKLQGVIAAGSPASEKLVAGSAIRIFTGSPMPEGADAVVMQEDTRPGDDGTVLVTDALKPWENIRLKGEDVRRGAAILSAGLRLNGPALGLLAAVGVHELRVGRRPVVGLLATGDELTDPGKPLPPGGIYESNRFMLAPMLADIGADVRTFPRVADSGPATAAALKEAFAACDIVVTTGGVSVGDFDFVKPALIELGGQLDLWRVAIKPGKPFVLGRCGGKLLLGLPGNPVSALVTFLLLVRPAVIAWQGGSELGLPRHPGILKETLRNKGDRRHFMRVSVDRDGGVKQAGLQASHRLGELPQADGLVDVPPETTWPEGAPVMVLRWNE